MFRCGHCKQFAPEYEKIAQSLKNSDPPVPVAKVDATKSSALGQRFEVSGYPTFKILKKGEAVEYDAERTEEGRSTIRSLPLSNPLLFIQHLVGLGYGGRGYCTRIMQPGEMYFVEKEWFINIHLVFSGRAFNMTVWQPFWF